MTDSEDHGRDSLRELLRDWEPACWITGLITDRNSRKPFAGVWVRAIAQPEESPRQRMVISDGRGRYTLPLERAGVRTITFRPSLGGAVTTRQVTITVAESGALDVEIDTTGASDPPYDMIEGTFEGTFSLGI